MSRDHSSTSPASDLASDASTRGAIAGACGTFCFLKKSSRDSRSHFANSESSDTGSKSVEHSSAMTAFSWHAFHTVVSASDSQLQASLQTIFASAAGFGETPLLIRSMYHSRSPGTSSDKGWINVCVLAVFSNGRKALRNARRRPASSRRRSSVLCSCL